MAPDLVLDRQQMVLGLRQDLQEVPLSGAIGADQHRQRSQCDADAFLVEGQQVADGQFGDCRHPGLSVIVGGGLGRNGRAVCSRGIGRCGAVFRTGFYCCFRWCFVRVTSVWFSASNFLL